MKATCIIPVLLVLVFSVSGQDMRQISGIVTDEQNKVIPGVSVYIEGTGRGTITDVNGFYTINVVAGDETLVFSFVGMVAQKVKIGKKDRVDVVLKAETNRLDEVVVAGYGGRKKINVTSSVTQACFEVGGIPRQEDWNTEGYSPISENGFKNVLASPLSTFSIDVDNASYSNVRRYINQGEMPPADAVRVEEMVNYFKYDYPEPSGEHPFSVTSELSECPWNKSHLLLHIGLKGKQIEKGDLPPSNLVFLIDVSGSMEAYNKLPLVKNALKLLVNELRPNDRVAIVVYAGAAGKVLDSTPGNKKAAILEAVEQLSAGGSTAGGEGLRLAYKIAGENFIEGGNNRIILATDGDFNVGVSSNAEMERLVEEKRKLGVFLTVLGFGMGNIKDDKMEILADKGNGNYAYIDNIQEARKMFVSEFGGTLFTIAKDVKFQLEFNPVKVVSYRLVGYENRLLNAEDFNDDTKDAGEMGAGHTVTALYEIVPAGAEGSAPSVDPLKYQDQKPVQGKSSGELLTIKVRYKDPDGNKSKLLEQPVLALPVAGNATSDNFRFSAAVASFGMLLRGSEFMGDTSAEKIIKLAQGAKGHDAEGYRAEFIRLVKTVQELGFFAEE